MQVSRCTACSQRQGQKYQCNGSVLQLKTTRSTARPLISDQRGFKIISMASRVVEMPSGFIIPSEGPPKGIIHFIGGAFIGAAPQVGYSLLLDLLARSGYTIATVPYELSFKHLDLAKQVYSKYESLLEEARNSDDAWAVPANVPTHGLGHSMGSLLHCLASTMDDVNTQHVSNILVSFNNKQVQDAIPVPGLMDSLSNQTGSFKETIPALASLATSVLSQNNPLYDTISKTVDPNVAKQLQQLQPVIGQVPGLLGEVTNGITDFTPTPSESRDLIQSQYSVPQTLVIKFSDDTIDESDQLVGMLREKSATGTIDATMPGTHITPLGGDVQWDVGDQFAAFDAVAQSLKTASQADVKRLAEWLLQWLDRTQ